MESSVLAMFLFLFLGAVVSHAVLPSEIYWKTMLPDVPMPKAVKELLQPGNARKDVSDGAELDPNIFNYNAGKQSGANLFHDNDGKQSGANIFGYNAGKQSEPNFFSYNVGKQSGANLFHDNDGKRSGANIFQYGAGKQSGANLFHDNDGKRSRANIFQYGAGKRSGANIFQYGAGKRSEPNIFNYNDGKQSGANLFHDNDGKQSGANLFHDNDGKQSGANIFDFDYSAGKHSEPKAVKELLQPGNAGKDVSGGAELDPNTLYVFDTESKDKVNDYDSIFFLEKELHPGSKINVHLSRSTRGATFLPRQQADAIPFSSDMLSKVMEKLSVKPHSMEAKVMEQTVKTCEEPAQEGEEKYCATSLESMVDFVVYKLGKNVHSISTEVGKEETSRQQYTTGLEIKRMGGANSIVCHNQAYAYPVYYCHATHSTKVYMIPFFTTEGSMTKTVAVCHTDTSKWNPEHLAFQVLKIKPGTIPVCHFLPEGHIVWTADETFA